MCFVDLDDLDDFGRESGFGLIGPRAPTASPLSCLPAHPPGGGLVLVVLSPSSVLRCGE